MTFTTFKELPLSAPTQKAVAELGFMKLTPIQSKILPYTLAGLDAIGQAQTGTGKTATFLITMVETLLKRPFGKAEKRYLGEPRAVILAPTRELAQQIFSDCVAFIKHAHWYCLCLTGGSDLDKQIQKIHKRPLDVVIATPGRLIDLPNRGVVFLDRTEVLVLDEADRMLDMGFIPDIKRLINAMPTKEYRQSLLFSATFNTDVMNLAYRWLDAPEFVAVEPATKTNANITQLFYAVADGEKYAALTTVLNQEFAKKTIIFANQKHQVRKLTDRLKKQGIGVVELSGDVAQHKRERHLQEFKDNKASVLVATDVAGRGIHVDDVTCVINYMLPDVADDYVHRIGRTGRAGNTGLAIAFVGEGDGFNLSPIEKKLGKKIAILPFDGRFESQPIIHTAQL